MPKKFKIPLMESEPQQKEYIGHITTPIQNDLERIKTILMQHGVIMIHCQTLMIIGGSSYFLKGLPKP